MERPYFNAELQKFQYDNLFECDALLLGRITYEGFAQAWPTMTDEQSSAHRMNSIGKCVASSTCRSRSRSRSRSGTQLCCAVTYRRQWRL